MFATASAAPVPEINGHAAWLKRERIISTASELFDERGYENTSLETIGQRMGVSKPFFYLHFAAKSEILAEICARGAVAMLGALNAGLEAPGTPAERLGEAVHCVVGAVMQNRRAMAILAREEKHLPPHDRRMVEEVRYAFDTALTDLIEDGAASGVFEVREPALAARAIGGMLRSAHDWLLADGQVTAEASGRELASLVVAMAGVRDRLADRTPAWISALRARNEPDIRRLTLVPRAETMSPAP
jgi:TetR/AcrR family transcriptional regulator, cholesterol catabolism regulator